MKTLKHLIIAGPCSAETPEQVMQTAQSIAEISSDIIYRAGIWKPRTKPNSFEGVGEIGLKWLQEVKKETGLKTATEVATAEHVESCLKSGIDVLWIGARTTVNPFAVQAIADALHGTNIPVFIKNPMHGDVKLWAGAFERIQRAGISETVGIHRGFHAPSALLRNPPHWELVDQFRALMPEVKVICDPSHISGNALIVPSISEQAVKRKADGLMIETHCSPETALSDKDQQLRPDQLKTLLGYLFGFSQEIQELRSEIDQTDEQLIALLGRRMEIAEKIAREKENRDIPILQSGRWSQAQERNRDLAKTYSIDPDFVHSLYEIIHRASIQHQELMQEKGK